MGVDFRDLAVQPIYQRRSLSSLRLRPGEDGLRGPALGGYGAGKTVAAWGRLGWLRGQQSCLRTIYRVVRPP